MQSEEVPNMTETQRKIKEYQAILPGLKERVMAVAMLLVVSLTMVVSATFAWITLSRAPEVTNVTTNIAANGNLEIALADSSGVAPATSKVGDSSAADGQDLTAANITWGNLVNLSDPSYGLSNIVLRPALLSSATNLLNQPLKGASYGQDGRMELYYNEDFQFTNWTILGDGTGRFAFSETPKYGVRAISTIQYEYTNDTYYQYTRLMAVADNRLQDTSTAYNAMITNQTHIDVLAYLIGQFMTDKLNDSDTDITSKMTAVYNLMCEFESVVASFEDVLVALANTQVYNKYMNSTNYPDSANDPNYYVSYTYTKESLFAATNAELKANGVSLTSLTKYRAIMNTTQTVLYGDGDSSTVDCILDMYTAANSGTTIYLSELLPLVNQLVHINTCQIITPDGTTYTVGSLGMSAATQLLGKDIDAKITKGILKDFEQLTGSKMCATNVTVSAKYIVTVSMKAKTITTTAADPYYYNIDQDAIEEVASANKEYKATAQDTYGMAIDFWVRTNATQSYLILEGNVLTETNTVRATGVDVDGNVVELYTVTITTTYENEDGTKESISDDVAVYQRTESQEDGSTATVWRNANDHSVVSVDNPPEGQTISTPKERWTEVSTVIGYEGENRVWDDNMFLDSSSTTQGAGSCYVFYAEDPGQQEYCLRLLSNLRVAFLDANEASATYGKVVAISQLDIDNRYEENGKVTLPLKLIDDGSNYLTKTEDGLAIISLEKNEACRLTAIVYLDGREISNADVLAANDIQGQLNLQFGSTVELNALEDEALQLSTRSVTVVSSKDAGSFPSSNSTLEYAYDTDDDLTVHVKMTVDGEQPTNVTAFFMRKVNETQGSREATFTLTKNAEDGCWYGSYTFSAPGEYVLRTVQLDGMDYTLSSETGGYPHVTISGFLLESVALSYSGKTITEQSYTVMTGDSSIKMDMSLSFKDDQKRLPGSVRLQFLKDDGTQVTTTLTYNSTTNLWTGSASFISSGTYTLKYVVMDGEYTELSVQQQRELTLVLGMTVRVSDTGEYRNTLYLGESITVPVTVEIYDNTDAEVRYLSNAKLVYVKGNSTVTGMSPDLKWNSALDCYVTNLQIDKPGIYTFNNVTVGANPLKKTVETPPTFTCKSPATPTYYDAQPMSGMDYLLSAEIGDGKYNSISVGVRLQDAEAATVTATLMDWSTGRTATVEATSSGEETINGASVSTFIFALPRNEDGYQSGDWEIQKLELIDVFSKADENSDEMIEHDKDNPYVLDLTKLTTDDLRVEVVNAMVEVAASDENLGGSSLMFMGSATASNPITVTITDQNGDPLNSEYIDINDLKITYKYTPQSSNTYGGYLSATDAVEDIELTPASNDGSVFTMPAITLSYAGEYLADSLTFNVAEKSGTTAQSFKYTSDERAAQNLGVTAIKELPRYTLTTAVPTVTITAITPTGTYSIDTNTSGSITDTSTRTVNHEEQTTSCGNTTTTTYYDYTWTTNSAHKSGYTSSISSDGKSATVYFLCDHTDSATYSGGTNTTSSSASDQDYHHYEYNSGSGVPSATLTLSNTGDLFNVSGSSAELIFESSTQDEVRLYTKYSSNKYTFITVYYADSVTDSYTWTSNTTCTRFVGYMINYGDNSGTVKDRDGNDTKVPAGTITADTLIAVYNGVTYTFTIPTITINNPY